MRLLTHGFRTASLATAVVLLLAACGNDTAAEGDGEQADGDLAAYCDYAEMLDGQETVPSAEQFDELNRLVPDEISAEIALVAAAFAEHGQDASHEPEVEQAFETIQAYEAEHCAGSEDDDAEA